MSQLYIQYGAIMYNVQIIKVCPIYRTSQPKMDGEDELVGLVVPRKEN